MKVPVNVFQLRFVRKTLVQISDCVGKLAPQDHLPRPLLDSFDQVEDDDGVAIPPGKVLKVEVGRLVNGVVTLHCGERGRMSGGEEIEL
jgi:hypothetical protein